MSEENVEIVRQHAEAFGRDGPRAVSFLDPYVVFDPSRVYDLDPAPAYGQDGVAQAAKRYIGAFEDYAFEMERLTDLGSGAILAVVTETGRGRSSGVPVRRSYATSTP